MKKKEDQFEKLARLIKEEGEDIRTEVKKEIQASEKRTKEELKQYMDDKFTAIDRRLDNTIQPQLDDHAFRIKVLEQKSR